MNNPPTSILIVDDIAHNITALQASLARPGLELRAAQSGTEALEILLQQEVAVAILDVNMPGMDGFELAELMRGSPRTSHVPIIFLTATAEDITRTFRGYEAGAVDFLHKPFDARILRSKVDIFVQLYEHKRRLADQLETTRDVLKANEMLMAVLGHDLRTPLSAVLASSEYLARFQTDDKVAMVADRIKRSSLRMVRMIDQLMNLARVQGGRLRLNRGSVELAALCKSLGDEFASSTGVDRIRLTSIGDSVGNWDGDLLSQALSNLFGNALHHGASGTSVDVEVDGSERDYAHVRVRNDGVIDPAILPDIFLPFRSGRAADAEHDGLGLGLFIVREIAHMHGGQINVKSVPESGTTFTLSLPRIQVQEEGGVQFG
jgi:two-component system, sensor histidine kinase and response regulator